MKILRRQEIAVGNADDYWIGDLIQVGKYTATCQKVTENAAVFLLDQRLDKDYCMNPTDTNEGGYETSELRRTLQIIAANDENFASVRAYMRPFDNGDLLRIPVIGEVFGKIHEDEDDYSRFEPDDAEQWALMKDRRNRELEEYGWYWLQNTATSKYCGYKAGFAVVNGEGGKGYSLPKSYGNVRPVFQLTD